MRDSHYDRYLGTETDIWDLGPVKGRASNMYS